LTPASVGLVMQGSGLGQVIGPVAVGGAIDRYGWSVASLIVAAAGLGGVFLAWRLRRLKGPGL
jgi:MFS family permease